MFGCNLVFSHANQVPEVIVGMGRVIYHVKSFSVGIRTAFKKFLFSNFRLIRCVQAYNSLLCLI